MPAGSPRIPTLLLAGLLWAASSAASQGSGDTLPPRPEIKGLACSPASPVPAGSPVRFSVQAMHPAGSPLEYSWEFDDGSSRTPWSRADTALSHVYAAAGLYAVRVRVQDTAGYESVRILRLQVTADGSEVPPRSSPLALDRARRRLWVANPDHNSISLLDADGLSRIREVPVGRRPVSLGLDPEGNVWVTCRGNDEIRVLSPDGQETLKSISLEYGDGPTALVFAPGGATAYASAEGSGRILRLDAAFRAVTGKLDIGPSPGALSISPDGKRMLVARFLSADPAGTIWSVDLPGFAAAAPIALPRDSTTLESGTAARGLPNYVAALAFHPDGKTAWYAAKKDNILRGLARDGLPLTFETSLRTLVGSLDPAAGTEAIPRRLDLDNTSQPSALAFAPYGNILFLLMQGNNRIYALDANTRHVLAQQGTGLAPQGLAVDADSGRVFVQDFLGRTVSVYAAADMLRRGADTLARIAAIPVSAREPLADAVLAGKRLFYNAADTRMSQDGYTSCAACHLDGGHDGRTWDFTDRGEGLRNTTTLLGKAGMGHGPLHWSANFDEMQDFEHDMRGPFGGKGFLPEAVFQQGTRGRSLGDPKAGASPELDALAAYVATLAQVRRSPYREGDGSRTAAGRAGEAVFRRADVGCAACHVQPSYTDSRLPGAVRPAPGPVTVFSGAASRSTDQGFLLHDVGTLKPASGRRLGEALPGLDTPTLLGIWETAPYLHDGSAATLLDVLTTANADDKHGRTSHLSAAEKGQLVAFLQELDEADAPPEGILPRDRGNTFMGGLGEVRSSGGRLLGLRLAGPWTGALPSLSLFDLAGRRVARFPATAWRKEAGSQAGYFLPWEARLGARSPAPGIHLLRAEGRAGNRLTLMLLPGR